MRNVGLILSRELGSYVRTPSAYFIAAVVLMLEGLAFNAVAMSDQALKSSDVLGFFFFIAGWITMAASIIFSVRLLAEDGANGTDILLFTSPIHEGEIVVGKYLAALVFLAVLTLVSIYIPALIFVHGKVSWGHVAAGYSGVLLVGASVLALGMFCSAITSGTGGAGPFLAVILCAVLVVMLELSREVAGLSDPPFDEIIPYFSLHRSHLFESFQRGLVRLSDTVFYLSVVYLSLLAATKVLQSRRWR